MYRCKRIEQNSCGNMEVAIATGMNDIERYQSNLKNSLLIEENNILIKGYLTGKFGYVVIDR